MLSVLLFVTTACLALNLKIGILALQGNQQVITQWNLTFQTYLPNMIDQIHNNAGLNVTDTHVNITVVPLGFQEIFDATTNRQIDLIYANPLIFACLEREMGIRSLVTVENARLGLNQSSFGGVIFARADSNITSLQDIKGKIFSAVDFTSLGGFQAGWVSLFEAGLDPFLDPKMITFAVTHDQVVKDVMKDLTADIGTARTDTLEKWFASPSLNLSRSEVRILSPQNYSGFPFIISTHVYPEWPLGLVNNTLSEAIVKDIVQAMLSLPADPFGSYSRWIASLSYQTLQQLLDQVNILNKTDTNACLRPDNVYESVVCPPGFYRISASAFASSCENENISCPVGHTCACGACLEVPLVRYLITPQNTSFNSLYSLSSSSQFSSPPCTKMEGCKTIQERDPAVLFQFEDTWRDILEDVNQAPVSSVQYRINGGDTSVMQRDWLNATMINNGFFQFSLNPILVGTYVVEVSVNNQQIDSSPFIIRVVTRVCFNGQLSNRGECQTPERNLIGNSTKVFGYIVAALALAILIGFLIWVILNRTAKPVAASQPFFLGVMIMGCTLTVLAIFPASMDDENLPYPDRSIMNDFFYPSLGPACEAQVWLYSLGFCFTFSALFAKVNRIRRVFQTKVLHRIRITIIDMLPQTLALVILMIIIKLSWTLSDSFSYHRTIIDENEEHGILASMGTCTSSYEGGFLGAIIAIQIACYGYGLYLCYVTRAFRAEFNEARYITFCMANNAQVLLLGAPIAALVADKPQALFLVKVFVALLTVAGQIAFLFAPKIFLLYEKGPNPDSFERSSKQSTSGATAQPTSTVSSLTVSVSNPSITPHKKDSTAVNPSSLQHSTSSLALPSTTRKHGDSVVSKDKDMERLSKEVEKGTTS